MVGPTTPLVVAYAVPRLLVYFTESAKYASSAVIRLRRSDFIAATYALSFVFANFGIAIAARMPMMTTTIKSSMRVKPFLLRDIGSPAAVRDAKQLLPSCMMRTLQDPFCNCVFPVRSLYRVTFSLTQSDHIV